MPITWVRPNLYWWLLCVSVPLVAWPVAITICTLICPKRTKCFMSCFRTTSNPHAGASFTDEKPCAAAESARAPLSSIEINAYKHNFSGKQHYNLWCISLLQLNEKPTNILNCLFCYERTIFVRSLSACLDLDFSYRHNFPLNIRWIYFLKKYFTVRDDRVVRTKKWPCSSLFAKYTHYEHINCYYLPFSWHGVG